MTPYVRVIVDEWTDAVVRVHRPDNGEQMRIADAQPDGLRPFLQRGSQLNVVNPQAQPDGTVQAEMLILEPDYLADISSVAACFETYAHSALVHLVNKIKPAPLSESILLGNFASQLLDEEVHHSSRSYAESISEFFRRNAIGMAACTTLGTGFHKEAQRQKEHIHQLMQAPLLAASEAAVSASEHPDRGAAPLLEPSFISEMLGLQGRMDFLQPEGCVVIEQKSGKGAFPAGPDPEQPREQLKHRVQLLLYMAVLRHDFGIPDEHIHAFLLYSKYARGLLRVDFSEPLLHEAIRVRNELVGRELRYASTGFADLAHLSADALNLSGQSGRLWNVFTRPELEKILSPMHQATALERAYVLRLLRFIAAEHVLSKMGTADINHAGFAAKWAFSTEEKRHAGEIMDSLTCEVIQEAGAVEHVRLHLPPDSLSETTNFRVGDIVILYSYALGEEPDARHNWVMRASIAEMNPESVTLFLRNPQTDVQVFHRPAHHRWALEHDLYDASFTHLYRSIYALLSASPRRRQVLLGTRPPEIDNERNPQAQGDVFSELVARARRARDFFLVIGPPGTGKTSFGLMGLLLDTLANQPEASLLLLSYTNRAVDEICSKLTAHGLDFMRLGPELSCDAAYRSRLLSVCVEQCSKLAEVQALIARTRIICATTAAMAAGGPLLQMKTFDLAIIDEASQILEPHLIGILSSRNGRGDAIRRFVLIGDHKQLPAVVQQPQAMSEVHEPELRAIGLTNCRHSLFERLLALHGNNPDITFMLTRQGRMHPDIAAFPSTAFYDGRLEAVPLPHQLRQAEAPRLLFIASPKAQEAAHDKTNRAEARIIADLAVSIYHRYAATFDAARTLGIIVPYRAQIGTVRQELALRNIEALNGVSIDTVERFQGSQRDVIIYGFTVHHPNGLCFLTENIFEENGRRIDRKLNVAMTRAREQLLLVGHAPLLSQEPVFAELIAYVGLTQPPQQP